MAVDTTGREIGEQGRVPDPIESTWYVEGGGFDFMSDIEDVHPLLGEQKQYIQGRVTWPESKLIIIGNKAIREEERFNVWSDDGFHQLVDDWEKADRSVIAGICFCIFFSAER